VFQDIIGTVANEAQDDTLIRISRTTNTQISTHPQPVQTNNTAFSWSGKELLVTGGDGTVKILDYPSMAVLHTLNAHTSSCYSLELSPPGTYLAIGGTDALLTLWDTTDWVCQRSLDKMTGPVKSLSFSFDGSYVVGGSDEGSGLDIAHVDSGEYVHRVDCGPAPVVQWGPRDYSLAYSVSEGSGGLRIINGSGVSGN
jgi:THO complex subunit 3